ncbi:urease accessory protein UreF [Haloactinomyces albus]|uniref:Urease accessory protein n=1 Tax=Haloactinomyces albus TaxID=1352928 RepID=A0AAE4CRD6_9ACTN|nr:urease accessory UreF family protein [Haloactinomyces albus]MDR7303613.1 urease accessory protein [Haloactinomyces albus]
MDSQLGALLLADARLPTGGHAHSAGLEPALAAGLRPDEVPEYLHCRLRSVTLIDAAASVLALRAARARPIRLGSIHDAVLARTPTEPMREASGLLGRGLARLASRWWPEHAAVVALAELGPRPQRPLALGVVAAAMGLDEQQVARACLYEDAQSVAAAALKLLPVDPTDAAWWVLDAAGVIQESVTRAVDVTGTTDLPAVTAPLIEHGALQHATRSRRIFVA